MRLDARFVIVAAGAALLLGCECEPDPAESPAPTAEAETEAEAPPPHPCESARGIREALDLGPVRLVRTELELTGEAPEEVVVWFSEADPGAPTDDVPTGAKLGRLYVLDCSGDDVRSLGDRTFSYVDDPQTVHLVASGSGIETRPVTVGDRTFLRVELRSLARAVYSERVIYLEVHEGAVRDVFACETARDTRTPDETTVLRREVRLVDDEGLRMRVRQQRDEGEIEEAEYVWSDDAFAPGGADLCERES